MGKISSFLKAVVSEMRKVSWPKRKVLTRYTRIWGKVDVVARVESLSELDSRYSPICNPQIAIHNGEELHLLKHKIKQCDTLIIRLPSKLGVFALYYANKFQKKYCIELVGDPWASLWYYGNIAGKFAAPIMTWIVKRSVYKSSHVIYVSRRFLQDKYPTRGYSVGCPDVVLDQPRIDVLEKRLERIRTKKDVFVLGLIGSLDVDYRGHLTVLKAMVHLREKGILCKVRFLGPGNKLKWQEVVEEFGLEESVEFCGTLRSGNPVFEWIDQIDILTMPTQTETLGRAIIEAMSRACPVIGSLETAIGEQIGSDTLCDAKDYKGLADIIARMAKDPDYMTYCAYENFYRSFKYTNKHTDSIREQFLRKFQVS